MFSQLFLWLYLFLYLTPLLITGIVLLRKTTSIDRYEILIPAGSVLGLTLFSFFINLFSFLTESKQAIYVAYLFLIFLSILIYKFKVNTSKLTFPSEKMFLFYVISVALWIVLIFWKGNNALIGSDTNLYYSIAHTFLKGNFPPLTPWQPDIPLTYHIGPFQLLAAFYLFTNLSFEFLHIFFSCFFIFCSSQIIIWIWKRHHTFNSFIIGNIAAAIVLISFGFIKLIIPALPLEFPQITNFQQFFLWTRNLPTVNQSIEVYGAAINLDSLIYFIFHSFGLSLALLLITIIFFQRIDKKYLSWIIFGISISALALINESVFILLAPALFIGQITLAIISKSLKKDTLTISLMWVIAGLIVLFQGGVITNTFFPKTNLENSILFFPSKTDSKEDFRAYHYNQEISKILPLNENWLPFRWFSIGSEVLIFIPVVLLIFLKDVRRKIFILVFLLSGLFSLLAYNFIVPKFLVANGNRLLAFSFIFLSLATFYSMQFTTDKFKNKFRVLSLAVITAFVVIPTVLPPLVLLSKNRFPEKKLIPHNEEKTNAVKWMEKNFAFNERVLVLDVRTPHPSGQSRVMVQAGVFAPVFPGDFKAYTIEASPQYFDIAYFLSPIALKELKISALLIDSHYFETILDIRKKQLENTNFFRKVFENSENQTWERILVIEDKYLKEGEEIKGTFKDFVAIFPSSGRIYIDNEENFNPAYLRRAIIFSLRNKDIYYLPQSGVYLNVEANINFHPPRRDISYNYLILGKNTNPQNFCDCQAKLIWKGLRDEVYVWEKI